MKNKYCVKCGTPMPLNAEFCPNCGAKQDGSTTQNVTINNYGSNGAGRGNKRVIGSSHPSTILEAYKTFWKKYVDFSSTSSRSEYWFVMLWQGIMCMIGYLIISLDASSYDTILNSANPSSWTETLNNISNIGIVLFIIYGIACIIPSIAMIARRLRDAGIGTTGIILLIIGEFVPFLNFIVGIVIFVISLMPSVKYE